MEAATTASSSEQGGNSSAADLPMLEVKRAFESGAYRDAELLLLSMPQDDIKVRHNLAVVQYLQHTLPAEAALTTLSSDMASPPSSAGTTAATATTATTATATGVAGKASGGECVTGVLSGSLVVDVSAEEAAQPALSFEGGEVSVYNRAVIYARCALPHKALALLRGLLRAGGAAVSTTVLVHSLCLFQSLTRAAVALGTPPRSKADEELVQTVLQRLVRDAAQPPEHMRLIEAAFADSSTLQEVFRTNNNNSSNNNNKATSSNSSSTAARSEEQQALYLNNLGVFLLHDSKAAVAALCFAKAQHVAAESVRPLVAYNAALCDLLRGDVDAAAVQFAQLGDFAMSPLYWVRVAQALLGVLQRAQQQAQHDAYEQQQAEHAALLSAGRSFANFDFLLLPGATYALTGPLTATKEGGVALTAGTGGAAAAVTSNSSNSSNSSGGAAGGAATARASSSLQSGGVEVSLAHVERAAATALQNALFLLLPPGHDYASALKRYPHMAAVLQHAMLYWAYYELYRRNYVVVVHIAQQLLGAQDVRALPATVYATLLCYVVEAHVHLNEPEQAMRTLRAASLAQLMGSSSSSGSGGGGVAESLDAAQRSRVEAVFANVVVAHILTGSWSQAHVVLESLLQKLYETAPAGATDYRPERDAMFTYQLLNIFLELAQGNQERAADWLGKLTWSI